jgi:hypothetical protein
MLSFTAVEAAPVVLVPWQTSGNGTIKTDDFGSVPNLDILYRGFGGFGAAAETDRVYVWALWGPVNYVSYSGADVVSIFLRPDIGWSDGVSLHSFELGSFQGIAGPDSEVRIYSGDFSSLLFNQSYALNSTAVTVSPMVSSLDGLWLQFSNTPAYVGITNITLEAGNVFANPVPEPANWAMMVLGFGAVGAVMRRRSNKFEAAMAAA